MNSQVKGPDNSVVQASWGLFNSEKNEKTGLIEMARASGLAMIDPKNLDPFNSTSFGTGELILDALKNGAKKIILGIGGSATNDCGIGVAKAVGIKFLDSKNNEVGNNAVSYTHLTLPTILLV